MIFVCLFDLIIYVPLTIFQLKRVAVVVSHAVLDSILQSFRAGY